MHVSQISINDRLLTATDRLRPPCRMYLTVGDAATWCPMLARTCRSHIKPRDNLSANSLVSKTTKHPFLPVAILCQSVDLLVLGGKRVPLRGTNTALTGFEW